MKHEELNESGVRLLARLGEMLLHWNRLESEARTVASEAAGATPISLAFVTGLNASALAQWMRLLADANEGTASYKDHIRHSANLLDRLRTYRNHYVHGFNIIMARGDQTAKAIIHADTRRGERMRTEFEAFGEADLIPVCNAIIEAYAYVRWVALAHDSLGAPRRGSETLSPAARPNLLPERKAEDVIDWFANKPAP